MFVDPTSAIELEECSFVSNSASLRGGAVLVSGSLASTASDFASNRAEVGDCVSTASLALIVKPSPLPSRCPCSLLIEEEIFVCLRTRLYYLAKCGLNSTCLWPRTAARSGAWAGPAWRWRGAE